LIQRHQTKEKPDSIA